MPSNLHILFLTET